MTKEMQRVLDVMEMHKLAVKSTMTNPYLTDPPDSFLPKGEYEWGNTVSDMWTTVELVAASLSDEVAPAVLEFQGAH
jgi:hypothetical protein